MQGSSERALGKPTINAGRKPAAPPGQPAVRRAFIERCDGSFLGVRPEPTVISLVNSFEAGRRDLPPLFRPFTPAIRMNAENRRVSRADIARKLGASSPDVFEKFGVSAR